MKKLLTFLTLLTLSIGVGWAADRWVQTDPSDLTTGDIVVIADNSSKRAMTNNNGTSTAPSAVSYTLNSDMEISSTVAANMQWVVTKNGNNFQFQVSGTSNYLYCTNTNNGVRVGTNSNNIFTIAQNTQITSYNVLKHTATSRFVGVYNNSDWRCYTTVNTNIQNTNVYFYKKVSGGSTVETVATPTFSPAEGTFTEAQNVTISCATDGATIYYTTDGNDPTTSSSVYSSAIPVSTTTTIKAIAVKDGMDNSAVASATYTISTPYTSLADVNALADNTMFVYGAQTVVLGANGKNMYIVMPDNTAGTLVYANSDWSSDYTFGKVINSGWGGTKASYSTKPEVKNPTGFALTGESATVTPIEITSSYLTLDNFGRYAVLKGVTVASGGSISGITVYDQFGVNFSGSAGAYDVYGVIGWHNNAPQFMPLEYVPASAPVYYLAGTFNNWAQSEDYMFLENNGTYTLNGVDLPDNAQFQIIKVVNDTPTWYGGSTNDNEYGIHGGWHENITLTQGAKNFRIEAGAITNFSFTVNNGNPSVLNVNRDPQLFIKTSNDNFSTKTALASASDGWTMNRDFTANESFGFVDEWGYWHGKEWTIKSEHFGQDIPMETSSNYVMELAGNYNLAVNAARSILVVTSTAGDGEYVKVTSSTDLTDGEYLIVYEDGLLAFDGSLETLDAVGNSISVTINDNKIPGNATVNAAVFTYDADAKTLKSASGYYIGQTSDANGLAANTETQYENTITFESGNANIVSGGAYLRYNSASNQTRFRYYKSTSYTGQKPVALYKKTSSVTPSDQVAKPVITPGSADATDPYYVYGGKQQITITCATDGATIYYTTDGTNPTTGSTPYSAPFDLTSQGGNATVKAIAVKTDLDDSEIAAAYYRFTNPNAPTFDPASGAVRTEAFDVTINSEYDDAVIYYMLDPESAPTAAILSSSGTEYDNPVNVSGEGSHTIYAMVIRNGIKSSVVNASYTITSGGTTGDGDYVKVTTAADLTDGEYLIVYEGNDGPFAFNGALSNLDATPNTIDVEINDFTIPSTPTVDAAVFTFDATAGTFMNASGVYIGRTSDANGLESGTTALTNTVSIDNEGNAVIISEGGAYLRYNANSGQDKFRYFKSSTYSAQQPVALYKKVDNNTVKTPVITPGSMRITEEFDATITCATEGATIYYTLDGTTPTTNSAVYNGPIHIERPTVTLSAIAVLDGEQSTVATAVYSGVWVYNLAEYNALAKGTENILFKNPVIVQYHYISGSGKSYIYVKDDTGCAYFHQPGGSIAQLENGDVIGAGFSGNKVADEMVSDEESNFFMLTDLANFAANGDKGLADPEHETVARIADATTGVALNNHYITIKKVKLSALYQPSTITYGGAKYFDIDNEAHIGYNKFNIDWSVVDDLDAYYDITGIQTAYNNVMEFHPTEIVKWEESVVTLRQLCDEGVTTAGENEYTISNNLMCVFAKDNSIWVKDDTGQSIWPATPADGDLNFEVYADAAEGIDANTRLNQAYYDQSNWCEIKLADGVDASQFEGQIIKGGTIHGEFTDKLNPTLENVNLTSAAISSEGDYALNYYMPANFLGPQECYNPNHSTDYGQNYFFMSPKPQEYAQIVWAVWDASTTSMIMSTDDNKNGHRFAGEFEIDLSMNDGASSYSDITSGATYNFTAIIKRTNSKAEGYKVYPLDLNGSNPATGINTVDVTGKAVKCIKYVNVAGIVSDRPFQGVNIVVTEYTDGTRTTSKMLRK